LHVSAGYIEFILKASALVWRMEGKSCLLNMESIPDEQHEYRFGSLFFANFYLGLDFGSNKIEMRNKPGHFMGVINDKRPKPNKPTIPDDKP